MIAAQAGDKGEALGQAEFMELVDPVLPAAHRLAVAMLRSQVEAEDAVQEATVKAWRHRDRFRRGADMTPWLLAIVANECRAIRRSRWWSVVRWPTGAIFAEDGHAGADDPTHLRRAIGQLPHEQKVAIVLRYYVDLSFEEVAAVLKISVDAAKSRTYRALKRLRLDPEVLGDE